ncbi:thiamine diphosphokinase [Lactobacillus sp. ESL0259]|uniref:thiamine diphosphokinase n=1 Tax=Lactobacillus sp. ESL0259 TaxID=2069346 RepID=UPI000EFA4624|nr:thiamine diphosphokinase [Lactobacillus sp. ESL0259]RMC60614.1 thiamine diphosphokinase [Lactobacillus sp. ESL0259]
MKSFALLGAPKQLWPDDLKQQFLLANRTGDLVIGVDRGALLLQEMGIKVDVTEGDFDSLQKNELAEIEKNVADIRYSNPEKDWTDAELAIRCAFLDYHVSHLTLFGATGGRLDHFLSNFLMALKPEFKEFAEKIALIDQQNSISFYNAGKHLVKRQLGYKYFGVVTLTGVLNLNINRAKYNLAKYWSANPVSFSSNEFLPGKDAFELSFTRGVVAVIQSKDINRFQNI